MRFYAPIQLGPSRRKTPEGFLVCMDVPLARTGEQVYGPGETPVADRDGVVMIMREETEVFRPETIASFEGKPVTDDHPPVDVTPSNWKQYARGHAINVRRGSGSDGNLLLGDLLIMDEAAIRAVEDGKREISCGYDAEYDELEPGRGRQWNILGNHIALVERGRCGLRCSIGDQEEIDMARTLDDGKGIYAQLRAAVMGGHKETAEALITQAEAKSGSDAVHIHLDEGAGSARRTTDEGSASERLEGMEKRLDTFEERMGKVQDSLDKIMDASKDRRGKDIANNEGTKKFDSKEEANNFADKKEDGGFGVEVFKDGSQWRVEWFSKGENDKSKDEMIEGTLQMEAPPGTNDAAKAKDSSFLADAYQDTVAIAEILAPGMSVPTFDRNAAPKKTLDTISKVRGDALELAYNLSPITRGFIDQIHGRRLDLAKMTHDSIRTLFKSVGAMAKQANNGHSNARHDTRSDNKKKGGIRTLADLNRANTEFYARKVG